jgi:hypothetical protein
MRNTLTIGLLVCMPTVALLAVAGVAVLAGNLRQRLGHATDLRLTSGADHDQLHDESLPCR